MIATSFGKNCEVVLHDLRKPEKGIVAIANGHITGRQIGGPLIGGPIDDKGLKTLSNRDNSGDLILNYKTTTRNGRTLKSSTIYFRNKKGRPVAALCINIDTTDFNIAIDLLNQFCVSEQKFEGSIKRAYEEETIQNFEDIFEKIISDAIEKMEVPLNLAEKAHKLKALKVMQDNGLFLIKGGVDFVANRLNVSRFTIYNYLKEIRFLK